MVTFDVVIVGGGHGGAQAAIALRQRKFTGTIAIIGEETELPYERPPLSKEYLAGEKVFDRLLIRPANFWSERNIEMRMGQRVIAIDAAGHRITTEDGDQVGYGQLIWAAGGHARRLTCTGHDLSGVHSIRSKQDVDQLTSELGVAAHIGVIGAGYIGLEAAAVLTQLGKRVTVFEAQERVLARVAGSVLSSFYEAEHRAKGVDLRLGVGVACITEEGGRAAGVRLHDGETIACDLVIVGVGIVPSVEPLLAAGAEGGNGVAVDSWARTSLSDVYAIGDCALRANDHSDGANIRIESVQNANDLAVIAACAIVGDPVPDRAVPWFWSNQYDLKLQTVGLSTGYDVEVLRGDLASGSFSVIYMTSGRVVALDCVNSVKDYVQGKALIENSAKLDPTLLADIKVSLKSLM